MTLPLVLLLLLATTVQAQSLSRTASTPPDDLRLNQRLSIQQFNTIATTCGNLVPAETLAAIATTESAFHPFALSINYPQTSAKRAGFANSNLLLARQPQSIDEASKWAQWFESHGYTVSVGLMQINTATARIYHVRTSQLFESCQNVRIGAAIISDYYHKAHKQGRTRADALLDAISAYNSGNVTLGYQNGYVGNVVANGHKGDKR